MSKYILVTGATGKQGGCVVDSLLALPNASDYTILAVTRDANSGSAKKLLGKSPTIKVVEGNLDDTAALFAAASNVAKGNTLYGVYSVQISQGKGVTHEGEIKQGKDMVDESVKAGVKHFVYSSVERGGDEASWKNPTPIPHFSSKYEIEHHLKDNAGSMGWTILRPVAFMDNLAPGMQTKVFMAAMRDTLNGKKCQWIATTDIGHMAAQAFSKPDEYNHKALGLAGDELSYEEINDIVARETGTPLNATYWALGAFLKYMVGELGTMINWFASDGYKVNIPQLRKTYPGLKDFATWLRVDSPFETK